MWSQTLHDINLKFVQAHSKNVCTCNSITFKIFIDLNGSCLF